MTAGGSSTAADPSPGPPTRRLTRWVHRNLPRPPPPALVAARGDGRGSLLWTTGPTPPPRQRWPPIAGRSRSRFPRRLTDDACLRQVSPDLILLLGGGGEFLQAGSRPLHLA